MKGAFIMSRKAKGSPEEKVAVIQGYLRGEISAAMAAEIAGVINESFRTWIRLYKQEWRKLHEEITKTSQEESIQIVKDCIE